jgi:hypothetical protein
MKLCAMLVLGLAAALSLGNATAEAAKGNKAHVVHGTIVDVQKDNGITTLTVKIHHHKKGEAAKAPVERKYQVPKATPVEIVRGKKGSEVRQPGTLADLHAGEHVAIVVKKGVAEKVAIRIHGKKNT